MSTTLRSVTAVALCNPPLPVTGEFLWDSDIPAEITMTLTMDSEAAEAHGAARAITWRFARELVSSATVLPGEVMGEGDITLWCEPTTSGTSGVFGLRLKLDDDTTATVMVEYEPLRWLLFRSLEIQPLDTDRSELLDAEYAALCAQGLA